MIIPAQRISMIHHDLKNLTITTPYLSYTPKDERQRQRLDSDCSLRLLVERDPDRPAVDSYFLFLILSIFHPTVRIVDYLLATPPFVLKYLATYPYSTYFHSTYDRLHITPYTNPSYHIP
jgi:hypothetical protein